MSDPSKQISCRRIPPLPGNSSWGVWGKTRVKSAVSRNVESQPSIPIDGRLKPKAKSCQLLPYIHVARSNII